MDARGLAWSEHTHDSVSKKPTLNSISIAQLNQHMLSLVSMFPFNKSHMIKFSPYKYKGYKAFIFFNAILCNVKSDSIIIM